MILEPDHTHGSSTNKSPQLQDYQQSRLRIIEILQEVKSKSQQRLSANTISQISQLRRFYEEKVYIGYSSTPANYLSHLLERNSLQTKDHVSLLVSNRQKQITKAIGNDHYEIKIGSPYNLKQIKSELMDKISQIKSDMESVSQIEIRQKKEEQLYANYMEFRKKGYWNQNSQKSEQVREFLSKMGKAKYRLKKKYENDLKRREQMDGKQLQLNKRQQEGQLKQKIAKSLQKQTKLHTQRTRYKHQNVEKRGEIKRFLSQYKTDKPLYVINEEKFKKDYLQPREQEIKKKLNDIKKNRKPLQTEQLQQHMRKYQQFKQKLQQVELKRQQQKQLFQRNQNQLRQLYHGHYHEFIETEMKNRISLNSEGKKYREKIVEYKDNINQKFRPKVDQKKKKQMQDLIRELQLNEDKSKRKKIQSDGTVIYEEKGLYDSRSIGKSYLSLLKKYNEGKPRKSPEDSSSSMMQLSKKPKIDYLRENRQSRVRRTLSGWKKVLDNNSLTSKDKYDSVMSQVTIMEQQARQKELQLRNINNKQKALEIKEELDKYYLESVAAKMVVLKDVILKE